MEADSVEDVNTDVQKLNSTPLSGVADATPAPGHRADGTFAPGNKCSTGNPFARRVNEIRSLLMQEVSDDDLRGIVRTLVKDAQKGGSIHSTVAAREILDRLIGKALQSVALAAQLRDDGAVQVVLDFGANADDDNAKSGC